MGKYLVAHPQEAEHGNACIYATRPWDGPFCTNKYEFYRRKLGECFSSGKYGAEKTGAGGRVAVVGRCSVRLQGSINRRAARRATDVIVGSVPLWRVHKGTLSGPNQRPTPCVTPRDPPGGHRCGRAAPRFFKVRFVDTRKPGSLGRCRLRAMGSLIGHGSEQQSAG